MLRFFRRGWPVAGALAIASVCGALACTSTGNTTVTPITGIVVRAETLTAGRGCGTAATQVYKYAVVVFSADPGAVDPNDPASYDQPVVGNVFDCFGDGAFVNLDTSRGSSFRLEVYAYDKDAFDASASAIQAAGADVAALRATSPTWTTQCSATQQQEVQALANCAPLTPGLGGVEATAPVATTITLATSTFRLADGRVATCGTGAPVPPAPDGGADAGDGGDPVDAGAVGDAGTPGEPVTFRTVRVRPRVGGTVAGATVDLACPAPYTAGVGDEPTTFTLDVGLIDALGTPLGETACTVTSRRGTTTEASCP